MKNNDQSVIKKKITEKDLAVEIIKTQSSIVHSMAEW